jgi:uncharacterized protein
MLVLTPEQLSIVKSILKQLTPDYTVWVFGSRAKGTTKLTADLDLAFIGKELSLQLESQLREAFAESDLPFKVDIVDWATTSPEFRQIITESKEVIQP